MPKNTRMKPTRKISLPNHWNILKAMRAKNPRQIICQKNANNIRILSMAEVYHLFHEVQI